MPVLTVIAGPNGSGKSTFIEQLVAAGTNLGVYLNADEIARDLTGSPPDVAARAQQIVRDARQAFPPAGADRDDAGLAAAVA